MKGLKELFVHVGLLVVAGGLALAVSTTAASHSERGKELRVEVWPGKPSQLERIEWDGKSQVSLEAHRDKIGTWYVGKLTKRVQVLKPGPEEQESKKPEAPKEETKSFVSVSAAKPLVEALAPLRAYRALGKLDEGRKEEFGFKEPEGTLHVTVGGRQHSLLVGGATPGGGDRYAEDLGSNTLYAISGDVIKNLTFADTRLFERELHDFDLDDINGLTVSHGGAKRVLTRIAGKSDSWGSTNDAPDETASNWVGLLNRLKPSEYLDKPPATLGPESVVVRVDYFSGRRPRGFLELSAVPGKEEGSQDYLVRTEYTRWYAKVLKSTGEQVAGDVASVVQP